MLYYAPAKINLSLDIIKKREDGYHELKMIMQTVSLYDKIDIEISDKMVLSSNKNDIPLDERNLVWKAADLFFNYTKISKKCSIYIEKNIPDGAGLGGGSSDAATTLIALNEIFKTNLSENILKRLAVKIGADVPFFIIKGTCLAEGIGEKLTKIENKTNPYILIYKPEFSISTKWAYENLKLNNKPFYDIDKIIGNLKNEQYNFEDIFNYLEDVSIPHFSQIKDVKNTMKNLGATASMMSGSGSSVFGIFNDKIKAKQAFEYFEKSRTFLVNFI